MGRLAEDDLIPLSALQHFLFCPRQCALIHVEQQWSENRFTAEGRILHEATDLQTTAKRCDLRIVRSMPIRSFRLGVSGVADVVELRGAESGWRPMPVEYKRGRPKTHRADEVQLCAQAVCLEEMFAADIAEGALFYGKTRRRKRVLFDHDLRRLTHTVALEARSTILAGQTPLPVYNKARCTTCSLKEVCWPKRLARRSSIDAWLARQVEQDPA